MAKIALIHGFNVRDGGRGTVGKLVPILEQVGHECVVVDYGYYNIFQVYFRKHKAIRLIVDQIADCDIVVGHSNGCNFQDMALRFLADHYPDKRYIEFRIAPALNRGIDCAANVDQCTVMYSAGDGWVWISAWLPFSRWGRQGQKGYKGDNPKMKNDRYTDLIPSHSGYFLPTSVKITAAPILAGAKQ